MNKLISICIPCRNEVDNVKPLAKEILNICDQYHNYDFEIIYIDNCSTDGTQDKLREMCSDEKRIKVILNAKNFPGGSGWYAMLQAKGDCIIYIPADFQVPPSLIPDMIKEWENGATVVPLIKRIGKYDKLRLFRKIYYKVSGVLSNQEILPGFTGSGLFEKDFIDICRNLNDPLFSMQYMITYYAKSVKKIEYNEQPRRSGKSNNSFKFLMHIAIIRYIHTSDKAPHYAIISGIIMGIISFLISIYYFVRKLIDWDHFPVGIAPLVIGMFFLGAIQLIFIGVIGEYVITIGERQKNKPYVIEKERINFDM